MLILSNRSLFRITMEHTREEQEVVVFLYPEGRVMDKKTQNNNNNKHHLERTPFDSSKLKHLPFETPPARTLRRYAQLTAATKVRIFHLLFQKINKNLFELHFWTKNMLIAPSNSPKTTTPIFIVVIFFRYFFVCLISCLIFALFYIYSHPTAS